MEHIVILRDLLKINSVSGKEFHILNYILKKVKSLNLTPFFVQGNLVVKLNGKDSSKALIFNAHVDTVYPGNSRWKYPPFEGSLIGNRMYGLGASDEKATITALLILAGIFKSVTPACDIWLTFVVKEEVDGTGTKMVMQWFYDKENKKYKSVAGILGEPTGLKQIEIAHKGNVFIKVTIVGDSGHASDPTKINNHAVFGMYDFARKLDILSKKWNKKYSDNMLGNPTVSMLTSIYAGDVKAPNKFPDLCTATFGIRTTPLLHKIVLQELRKISGQAKIEYVYPPAPYGYTDKSTEIVKIAQRIIRARITVSESSNDLCFFTVVNIPAIVLGPGEKECIHKQNEYCNTDEILKCVGIYKKIIEAYGN